LSHGMTLPLFLILFDGCHFHREYQHA
jgi:hypothetical protein